MRVITTKTQTGEESAMSCLVNDEHGNLVAEILDVNTSAYGGGLVMGRLDKRFDDCCRIFEIDKMARDRKGGLQRHKVADLKRKKCDHTNLITIVEEVTSILNR